MTGSSLPPPSPSEKSLTVSVYLTSRHCRQRSEELNGVDRVLAIECSLDLIPDGPEVIREGQRGTNLEDG